MTGFSGDLRFALRQLLRSPGFSLIVVITLALGIGATTSIFSFVQGVLLKPLPYPEPNRIVMVCETHPDRSAGWCGASPANWMDWSRRAQSLEHVGLGRSWPFSIVRDGRARGVAGGIATPGLFQTFAVQPQSGRLFDARDIETGNNHVAIVSHSFWQSWLGGAAGAVGMRLDIDGTPHEIVGVLPAGFTVPHIETVDVWVPLWPERLDRRDWRGFVGFARLGSGTKLEQARAEMSAIRNDLAQTYPQANEAWGIVVDSLHDREVRSVRPALYVFLAAVGLLLVVACANVANLLLARASVREREIAVRLAMGAARGRIVRQLMIESLIFAMLGGTLGVLVAVWTVDLFAALAPAWFPRLGEVRVDGGVLAFVVALSAVASLLFGLVPAWHATRPDLNDALRGGRGSVSHRAGGRLREILVVAEVALACVLLAGSGLLLRSFANLLDWQPGFDRSNLFLIQAFRPQAKYPTAEATIGLYERAAEELRAVPGVAAVGAGSALPLYGGDGEGEFYVEGHPIPTASERPTAEWFDVDTNYFQTLGVPLLRGRLFTAADRRGAPFVAVINETLAARAFPGANPVGQRIHMVQHKTTFEVVGVVGDMQPFRPDQSPKPQIYWPFAQGPRGAITFIVRGAPGQASLAPAIRARLEAVDPDMSLSRVMTMDERVAAQLVNPRFNTTLVGIFAALALVIAMVGVYGVLAFSVAQRTREIGVRMALGAHPADIFRLVVRKGLALALVGTVAGLAAALGATRLLRNLLIGVGPTDPLTFVAISVVLVGVALLACYLPARRATKVDPLDALRCE